MEKNKFIIAGAGTGKTSYLVKHAQSVSGSVLITTYTREGAKEIERKFIRLLGYVPSNIIIKTWFTFLLEDGIKPFQGHAHECLRNRELQGIHFANSIKDLPREEDDFESFYMNSKNEIYSNRIAKLFILCNQNSNGMVLTRLSRIFSAILIDEIQDLTGYDLDIIKFLGQSTVPVVIVGDPRQCTYSTHYDPIHNKKYKNGQIRAYLNECCSGLFIEDTQTCGYSHRNNQMICNFSYLLYKDFPKTNKCPCCPNVNKHSGLFLVATEKDSSYIRTINPVVLKWSGANQNLCEYNMGASKGRTFNHVLVYLTNPMKKWMLNHEEPLAPGARAKLYVAITRARYSVAFVMEQKDIDHYNGNDLIIWNDDNLF